MPGHVKTEHARYETEKVNSNPEMVHVWKQLLCVFIHLNENPPVNFCASVIYSMHHLISHTLPTEKINTFCI